MRVHKGRLVVLHAAFGMTGVLHAIGGALLPAIATGLGLTDSRSGTLFLCYYIGSPLGALLCAGRYVRLMTAGFLLTAAACGGIAAGAPGVLPMLFFAMGVGVGIPMTAVSMYAGRAFAGSTAAPLTLLNFTWSAGALAAPLLAARVLTGHGWRTAYGLLAVAAAAAAVACWLGLQEPSEEAAVATAQGGTRVWGVVVLFAFLAFLEVGIENTTATWLASYAMRVANTGVAKAAASSSLYWCGFLASRGLWALLLERMNAMWVLIGTVVAALVAAGVLVGFAGAAPAAMLLLGAALAPVFPLVISRFFARGQVKDSRWVLSTSGFGGSVLPWLTGVVSSSANSLRLGLCTVPAALAVMLCLLPLAQVRQKREA
jgi:FHS family glucose/mannose:H+ symporter-like MFS transporter